MNAQVQAAESQSDVESLPIQAGKYIFSGPRFRKTGPVLVFDALGGQPSRVEMPVIGVSFTLSRFKRRFCIGRYNLATSVHEPCPRRAVVEDKITHCADCEHAIGFTPAFYNVARGELSLQQRRYNETPHIVYLAWFSPSLVKVGISSYERRQDRWLEQGAIGATVIFNAPDAYEARKLEEMVSSEFKFREVVRSNEKLRGLFPRPDSNVCALELGAARWDIAKLVSSKVEEGEVFYGKQYYFRSEFPDREPINLSNESPLIVSGMGYGIIGDILLVTQGTEYYCVRLKTMLAHVVEISARLIPNEGAKVQRRLL